MTYWQMIHADRQHPSVTLFLAEVVLGGLWVCRWLHLGGSSRKKLGAAGIVRTTWHTLLHGGRAGPSPSSGPRAMVQ